MTRTIQLAVLSVVSGLLNGCSRPEPGLAPRQGEGHDHVHDVPITKADVKLPATYEELVSRIIRYDQEIEAAIKAGKPTSAHRALDELDIVLDETMRLGQTAVPSDQLGTVNESRQAIRNAFLEMHQSIDANEKPDYEAKRAAIQAAIANLKAPHAR